jgi:hypothetical protein
MLDRETGVELITWSRSPLHLELRASACRMSGHVTVGCKEGMLLAALHLLLSAEYSLSGTRVKKYDCSKTVCLLVSLRQLLLHVTRGDKNFSALVIVLQLLWVSLTACHSQRHDHFCTHGEVQSVPRSSSLPLGERFLYCFDRTQSYSGYIDEGAAVDNRTEQNRIAHGTWGKLKFERNFWKLGN